MATQTLLHTFSSLSIILLQILFETSLASPYCAASTCGVIRNISYPFRLKGDPKHCGDRKLELTCENNVTFISLNSHKYYVKEIRYGLVVAFIKLADASLINNHSCSFPNTSAYAYNFTSYGYPFQATLSSYAYDYAPRSINFMSCPHPLKNSSLFTQNTTHCRPSYSNSPTPNLRYTYIKVDHMKASEVPETCRIDVIVLTSWKFKDLRNASLSEIHNSLLYGFELRFCLRGCREPLSAVDIFMNFFFSAFLPILLVVVGLTCAMICPPVMAIVGFISVSLLVFFVTRHSYLKFDYGYSASLLDLTAIVILAPRFIIFPFALWFLIYKCRRRHLSVYGIIESFLQSDNKLAPIRYSYSDIKKMTRGFKNKLGEGGYGSVYKGKLRSGRHVAVKVLTKSGANDQDFINEVSTIGRIHHVNVIKLIGYCAQSSNRALVLDFMPNGSLDKYIFNRESMTSLNLDTKFEIAVGVARGIEYLHRGCDVQILHFDIKPHNVLLDDNFVPKISDFGLAKFYPIDKNVVTMTAARGTIGYVAPELISRSIGAVSYKADVYSFGMLLTEMVNLKKDLIGNKSDSNMYFPNWIYGYFKQGKDIEIENNNDYDDSTRRLVRKMTIVALWCIQMYPNPNDRPSMNKVLEMLEGNPEHLQIPDYLSQSTQNVVNLEESGSTNSADSVPLLSCEDVSLHE